MTTGLLTLIYYRVGRWLAARTQPDSVHFIDARGNPVTVAPEDVTDFILAEVANLPDDDEDEDDGPFWVLNVDAMRQVIHTAIDSQDEDMALLNILANTDWLDDDDD